MIRDRTIICLANRWNYDPTSKHQVMKRLARHNQIVWVNYRGTRKPRASAADLRAIVSTLRDVVGGAQRVSDTIVQVTPLVIPGGRSGLRQGLNRHLLVRQIRRVLQGLPKRPVQVWTFAPDVAFLAGRFDEERLIYYCVDEYSAFEDFDGEAIRAAERCLIERADVVITTSASLQASKSPLHPETHLVRHGVDVDHFAAALDEELPIPQDIAALPRPLLGFFGLVHHWFDVDLVARVARERPGYSFVLLGDCHADVSALGRMPNVHLIGRRDYSELPAYCRAFDAALLPFRINEMTVNINPIKLREYLAAGLPVVSTPLPEARRYEPDVFVADGASDIASHCDAALRANSATEKQRRLDSVAAESWDAVVERLSAIVSTTPNRDQAATHDCEDSVDSMRQPRDSTEGLCVVESVA